MLTNVRHYDGVGGRVHEATTTPIRGEVHRLSVQLGAAGETSRDAAGLALLRSREAEIAARPAQYERTGKEFLDDRRPT